MTRMLRFCRGNCGVVRPYRRCGYDVAKAEILKVGLHSTMSGPCRQELSRRIRASLCGDLYFVFGLIRGRSA